MSKNTSPSDLYVLLVGINAYKNNKLHGCLNDVDQVKDYLANSFVKDQFRKIHQVVLLDDQAKKDKIVLAFKNHLGKAKQNDTVLFYFSGHGAREKTKIAIFQEEEVDHNIGGVLCYGYEGIDQPDLYRYVLSNKELRYLIRPLAVDENNQPKSHVLAIFDCCNSGSNTRSFIGGDQLPDNARQVSFKALPGRTLHQFIFGENEELIDKLAKKGKTLNEIMPQGDHVMIAACREVELAWETTKDENKRGGAFTNALIEVLEQHKGHISYHELHSRVQNRMKFSLSTTKGNKGQTPQVYVRARNLQDRYNLFLTNQANDEPAYGSVEYSVADKEWRIDLGAFHGIPIQQKAKATKIKVYPIENNDSPVEASIKQVFPFYAVLDFSAASEPKKGVSYRGEFRASHLSPIKLFVTGEKEPKKTTVQGLRDLLEQAGRQAFKLVADQSGADYVLHARKGAFSITFPFEEERSLVREIAFLDKSGHFDPQKIQHLYHYLLQISRWSFFKQLEYSSHELTAEVMDTMSMYPVEFCLFHLNEKDGTEQRILPRDHKFILPIEDANKPARIRIELINHAPQLLNCSLGNLSNDFGFSIDREENAMGAPVLLLRRGDEGGNGHIAKSIGWAPEEFANEEKYFGLDLEEACLTYNLPGDSTFFKLIVSTKPIDAIETFHMKSLKASRTRSADDDWGDAYQMEDEPELPEVEWDVRTIEIYMPNPEYDPGR